MFDVTRFKGRGEGERLVAQSRPLLWGQSLSGRSFRAKADEGPSSVPKFMGRDGAGWPLTKPRRTGRRRLYKWTRLSCHDFVDNQVRLQLFMLACNLGNFLRQAVLQELFQTILERIGRLKLATAISG